VFEIAECEDVKINDWHEHSAVFIVAWLIAEKFLLQLSNGKRDRLTIFT